MKRTIPCAALLLVLSTPVAADLAASVATCSKIESPDARLACYDAIAMPVGPDAVAEPPVEAVLPAEPEPAPVVESTFDAEEMFGKSEHEIQEAVRERSGEARLERLVATAQDVRKLANGRLSIKLDNGQEWRQVVAKQFRVRAGDVIEIRSGRIGSFFLKVEGSKRSIRVRRVD